MRDRVVAGLFRAARIRQDLRQTDVSERCGLSRATIGRHEDGDLEGTTVRALRKHAEALGLRVDLTIRGQTGEILRDEEHAAIGNYLKHELETDGWEVVAEASYSIYGERGRIDLLG
ncbi:MAG: helix-turn-helix domain-containing protein, partial [Candidatus Limnocylindria bacterium]